MLRRGATPAVLRLYDPVEGDRSYQTGDLAVLLVLDEGEPSLVDATIEMVEEECETALGLDVELVERWMGHRNDVSQLEKLISGGLVVDTMEITGPWSALPAIYDEAVAAIKAVPGTLAASAHQSHAYPEGACLYFTFAGKPDPATPRTPTTGPSGTPAPGPCWPGAVRSATTTAWASTGPGSWPRRWARPTSPWAPSRWRSIPTASSTRASSACPARSVPTPSPSPMAGAS